MSECLISVDFPCFDIGVDLSYTEVDESTEVDMDMSYSEVDVDLSNSEVEVDF